MVQVRETVGCATSWRALTSSLRAGAPVAAGAAPAAAASARAVVASASARAARRLDSATNSPTVFVTWVTASWRATRPSVNVRKRASMAARSSSASPMIDGCLVLGYVRSGMTESRADVAGLGTSRSPAARLRQHFLRSRAVSSTDLHQWWAR